MKDIEHIRKAYHKGTLEPGDLTPDPLDLFRQWWHEAVDAQIDEANAMTLATVDEQHRPTARIVLLKGVHPEGFEFFTNYNSRKAVELEHNPNVALLFFWKELERQIRIEGTAERVSAQRSESYFQTRPRGNQIGAWTSPQSQVIPDRTVLEQSARRVEEKYANVDPLPRPEHWGGYVVKPVAYEFWQGRPDRLHDRFRYSWSASTLQWSVDRLAP